MATTNKNFRIKHGLIVEGTSGTIGGHNILTESTSGDQYIINLIGGETLVKSVAGNLSVDGAGELTINETGLANNLAGSYLYDSSGTVNVDVEGLVTDGLVDTSSTQTLVNKTINGADNNITIVADDVSDFSTAALSATASAYDAAGSASAAQTAAAADATTKAATAKSEAISAAATDATTKADAAQAAAISAAAADATTKANAAKAGAEATAAAALSSAISTEVTNRNTAISAAVDNLVDDAPGLLDTLNELAAAINDDANYATTMTTALAGKANASDVTTSLAGKQDTLAAGSNIDITGSTISVTGLDTDDVAEGTNLYFTNQRAIDAVGGSATSDNTPDTVVKRDGSGNFAAGIVTVNELTIDGAGSITNNADDFRIQTTEGGDFDVYADDVYFSAGDDIRLEANDLLRLTSLNGAIHLDATNAYFGTVGDASARIATEGYVDTAQTDAEATAQAALDNVLNGTTAFTEINVNSEAKQIAATSSSLGSVVVTAYQWAKADYRSGKFLVKIDNGTHNEISEILVTLDSSDNVAITEYAIVGTNGSRGTITATVSGANVQLRVDPVNDSTIKVSGTLLK